MVQSEDNTPPRSPQVSEDALDEGEMLEVIDLDDLDDNMAWMTNELMDGEMEGEDEEDGDMEDDDEETHFTPERDDASTIITLFTSSVLSCSFHPKNSDIVALGGMDDNAFVCDTSSDENRVLLKCDGKESVDCVRFSPSGDHIAVVNLNSLIKIFNTSDYTLNCTFDLESDFSWLAWHPTFPILFVSTPSIVTMMNIPTKASKMVGTSGQGDIHCGKIFPDGKRMAFGTEKGSVLTVDLKTCTVLSNVTVKPSALEQQDSYVYCMDVHRDGSAILCGCDSGDICIVNPNTSKVVMFPVGASEDESVEVVEFAKTEEHKNIAASCHLGGKLRFWDTLRQAMRSEVDAESTIVSLKWHPHQATVFTIQTSPCVLVVDALSGTITRKLLGHTQMLLAIDVSYDGSRIVTASNDQTARIYKLNAEPSEASSAATSLQG